jgi:hypothetical protein
MKKLVLNVLCLVIVSLLITPTSSAPGLDDWQDGDEEEITGHSFDEEYWTAEITNETQNGEATLIMNQVLEHYHTRCMVCIISLLRVMRCSSGLYWHF